MTGGRLVRTAAGGIAVALAYVVLAAVTGHLDPLERRPVLDGLAPPPPYRWVSPPPALAAANQPAESADLDVPIANGVSTVGVFLTPDSQAAVLLQQGAVPLPPGTTKATFRLHALAPPAGAVLPPGVDILGNVYRIDIVVDTSAPSTAILTPAQVALVYPAQAGPAKRHVVLRSDDGTTFQELGGNDNPVAQQVVVDSSSLGYFAIGATAPGAASASAAVSAPAAASIAPSAIASPARTVAATASPAAAPPGRSLLPLVLVGVPIALLIIYIVVEVLVRTRGSRRL